LAAACAQATNRLQSIQFARALWNRHLDVWTSDAAVQSRIANRLGWLSALDFVTPQLDRIAAFAESVRTMRVSHVVLLGMGGSSLAPEVMRRVLGVADGWPHFRMLDSVDPDAVRAAMDHAGSTLFILASKSGSTIEPNAMAAEAMRRLRAAGHEPGSRFVAITDEGTALHRRAIDERFRDVFVNPADIGGRYSALSFFGVVPAALMGVDIQRFVRLAREMETACRIEDAAANPGLALGALMAAGALHGRDKLTLLLPERLAPFGLWVEQLVAESTGKEGKGVVPITGEPAPARFGPDRIAVVVTLAGHDTPAAPVDGRREGAVPTATLSMAEPLALGAEFLRWEVATAAAGLLLDINPFDEPNVQQAKDATRALLDVHAAQGRLPMPEPTASLKGARLATSNAVADAQSGALDFLTQIRDGDYFCLLAYLPPDGATFEEPLQALRSGVAGRFGCATMFGYGPRYLHSTGQLHKGGANNGVFVVVTAEATEDLAIPDEPFSFGVLELAQGLGDFQSLDRTGRRALHVHLPRRDPDMLRGVADALLEHAVWPR
jgi:glucose-6-phosphate isomerase/transaldolase/glucose-6-phosphate isomerase